MIRASILAAVSTLAIGATAPAQSQEMPKIRVGCTLTGDCGSAMVAVDNGIFERLGLDVEMVLMSLNSTIPPALVSNSIEIGGPTSTVFLQAVDGGLDLVALAGASVMHEAVNEGVFAIVRNGVTIQSPQDFVGKKVGVPGFGAYLHILFVRYLMHGGVDPAAVDFVETPFSSMVDVIRTAAVDAVLAGAGPTAETITSAGTGSIGPRFIAELGGEAPIIFYAASREWAEANPELVAKFRQGIIEGAKLANSDREIAIKSVATFTERAPELIRSAPPTRYEPNISAKDLDWWLNLMRKQELLQGNLNVAEYIAE